MFREEIKKIPMDRKALRNFGLLMAGMLLVVGGWMWWKSAAGWPWIGGGAVLLAIIGLAMPMILKPLYRAWMIFALILGWIMTCVILALVYFLVVTPIGYLGRALGEQFLHLKRSGQDTYWVRKTGPARQKSDYERQF
ncbi:MAG TPA: SxtJ family membrane protein [Syntrophales bacterium]|nr:SxtJ family membrane protein [Syntrophales bacterium]